MSTYIMCPWRPAWRPACSPFLIFRRFSSGKRAASCVSLPLPVATVEANAIGTRECFCRQCAKTLLSTNPHKSFSSEINAPSLCSHLVLRHKLEVQWLLGSNRCLQSRHKGVGLPIYHGLWINAIGSHRTHYCPQVVVNQMDPRPKATSDF